MPAIPRKPQPGERPTVLPKIIGDLIDCVRAWQPRPSADIAVSTTAQGTTFRLKHKAPAQRTVNQVSSTVPLALDLLFIGYDASGRFYAAFMRGYWTHRYTRRYIASPTTALFPSHGDALYIQLDPEVNNFYVYVEWPTITIGYSAEYPSNSVSALRIPLINVVMGTRPEEEDAVRPIARLTRLYAGGDIFTGL